MQVSHRFTASSAVFDDEHLVSCAGLVPVMALATQTGLSALLADKVHIVLLSTDDSKPLPERIARQANKVGLFNALSFGDIMLRSQLKETK